MLKDGVCDAGDVTISVPKECKKVNIKPISFRSCRNERLDEDVVEEIYTLVEFILKENTEKAVFEFKINE